MKKKTPHFGKHFSLLRLLTEAGVGTCKHSSQTWCLLSKLQEAQGRLMPPDSLSNLQIQISSHVICTPTLHPRSSLRGSLLIMQTNCRCFEEGGFPENLPRVVYVTINKGSFLIFYVLGSYFRTLAVILVSDLFCFSFFAVVDFCRCFALTSSLIKLPPTFADLLHLCTPFQRSECRPSGIKSGGHAALFLFFTRLELPGTWSLFPSVMLRSSVSSFKSSLNTLH